jgi:hypothetical protein
MSDSTNPAETPDQPTEPAALQLQRQVKSSVVDTEAGAGDGSTRSRVVGQLVEAEMERRVGLLSEALRKRATLDGDLRKIKPDNITLDDSGNKTAHWSEAKFKERAKAQDRLTKLDGLINNVIENPTPENYDKLSKHK